jgi:hypothetical protein
VAYREEVKGRQNSNVQLGLAIALTAIAAALVAFMLFVRRALGAWSSRA